MAAVKVYKVTPLKVDMDLVAAVMTKRDAGAKLPEIAKELGKSTGVCAFQQIIFVSRPVVIEDSAKLARAVAKDRKAGVRWPQLAAKYRVTEACAKRAYEAATGQPYSELDFRPGKRLAPADRGAKQGRRPAAKAKPRKATAAGAKRDRGIATAAQA